MFAWFNRINLLWAFILLAAAHALLYYSLHNPNWVMLAILAALVDTGVIAVIQTVSRVSRGEADK
ncbi:hypothetical protein FE783_31825 [Paenibacillus mesophilus]|uniref:hypothetical protein n=1 Tax=Paenibacillus mesophilus TaxID=2582849 RepID=UPI00110F2C3E|nr:hypothetical protein [Paenibacillus mesophilus]TMV44591.1 hypothetical protein FE783_31825 [Paenibacillus mesophilus]